MEADKWAQGPNPIDWTGMNTARTITITALALDACIGTAAIVLLTMRRKQQATAA